jgi:hypothetical protein
VLIVLDVLGWSLIAAAAGWALTLSWARAEFGRARRAMESEVQHWQAEAIRARELAARLKQEIAMWSKGCQQGREDVIALMPLLVAAQQRLAGASMADGTSED